MAETTLRHLADEGEIADLTWEAPDNLAAVAGEAFQSLIAHVKQVTRSWRVSGAARNPAHSRKTSARGQDTTEIRAWAKAQGIDVKDRGRIPAELVAKFRAATRS